MSFHNPDRALERSWNGSSPAVPARTGICGRSTRSTDRRRRRRRHPGVDPQAVPYAGAGLVRQASTVDYAELHCHTNFSFLDGASHPEELAAEAARLGLAGLAVTDHDGFYGVVRFAEAARELGLPTVFGAELSLGCPDPQNGEPDPAGRHLLVLARGPEGYARLSAGHRRGPAGRRGEGPARSTTWSEVAAELRDHVLVLTGCRKGPVPAALLDRRGRGGRPGTGPADRAVRRRDVVVELTDHGRPARRRAQRRPRRAGRAVPGCATVATGNVHYATPGRRRLATALAAVRARRSLDEIDGWLPAAGTAHLRSGAEMARAVRAPTRARWPAPADARRRARLRPATWSRRSCPTYPVPAGHTEMSWLRAADHGRRAGPVRHRARHTRRRTGSSTTSWTSSSELGFPGYFLVVYDIVTFCREQESTARGGVRRRTRRSATRCGSPTWTPCGGAALRAVPRPGAGRAARHRRRHRVRPAGGGDPARLRQVRPASTPPRSPTSSPTGPGRRCATSPRRSASRPGSRTPGASRSTAGARSPAADADDDPGRGGRVRQRAADLPAAPGHPLRRHGDLRPAGDRGLPGGVGPDGRPHRAAVGQGRLRRRRAGQVRPARARHALRAALRVRPDRLRPLDLRRACRWTTPRSTTMLCRADSVGVFQVESRAQMATLPRLQAAEVLRPGGRGGADPARARSRAARCTRTSAARKARSRSPTPHPLMRERAGEDAGRAAVPGAADADGHRRGRVRRRPRPTSCAGRWAPSARPSGWRALKRPAVRRAWPRNGITGELADDLYLKLSAFANYGFPESHAMSFAYLVFASAWLKRYHPAAFCAALLNAQPMGFYSPQSLVDDARRHGVEVRRPGHQRQRRRRPPWSHHADAGGPRGRGSRRASGGGAGRWSGSGSSEVRTIGTDLAERIEAERGGRRPVPGHARPGPARRR